MTSLPTPRRPPSPASRDAIVRSTDGDASSSRLSAVSLGYLTDPFAALLHPSTAPSSTRKYPLINRGTYTRTTALDALIAAFLRSTPGRKQVVSLGAGSDTRWFRFRSTGLIAGGGGVRWHELDFPEVTRGKIAAVRAAGLVDGVLDGDEMMDEEEGYYVHALDLRTLKPGRGLLRGMERELPTLVISECCLIYLEPAEADGIGRWVVENWEACGMVLYEPIGGDDAFGRVMVQNLASRGIVLRTLKRYSSLERQKERFKMLGFVQGQSAADVDWVYERWVSEAERRRISELEMLDEVEEWQLLARHYCVAWGWKGEGWTEWGDKERFPERE